MPARRIHPVHDRHGGRECRDPFERDIASLGAGAAVLFGKTRISLDVMSDDSDEIVVRTDYTSRLRMRGCRWGSAPAMAGNGLWFTPSV